MVYFTAEAVYQFSSSMWVVAALVLWEGLLGGAAYVQTFSSIATRVRNRVAEASSLRQPPGGARHARRRQPH